MAVRLCIQDNGPDERGRTARDVDGVHELQNDRANDVELAILRIMSVGEQRQSQAENRDRKAAATVHVTKA